MLAPTQVTGLRESGMPVLLGARATDSRPYRASGNRALVGAPAAAERTICKGKAPMQQG